jgi:hypothetical protein
MYEGYTGTIFIPSKLNLRLTKPIGEAAKIFVLPKLYSPLLTGLKV